jgi:predicted nucleic acid-binding protein
VIAVDTNVLVRLVTRDDPDQAARAAALAWAEGGMDFADALHLASGHRGEAFATFDACLVNKARALEAGRVETP